jgi:hypothetical protein
MMTTMTVVEHWIEPADTFQGICLHYGISAMQLRRANFGFSGSNLALAPNPLKIPIPTTTTTTTTPTTTTTTNTTKTDSTSTSSSSSQEAANIKTADMLPLIVSAEEDQRRKSMVVAAFQALGAAITKQRQLADTEARCYLELNDWNVNKALENLQNDLRIKQEEAWDPNGEIARFDTPIEYVDMDEE